MTQTRDDPPSSGAPPLAQRLAELEHRLASLEQTHAGADAIARAVPAWCISHSSDPWTPAGTDGALGPTDRDELRRQAHRSGLAMIWLGASGASISELDELATRLDDPSPAGKLPVTAFGQAVGSSTVTWVTVTIGDAARAALRATLGRGFASERDYLTWRRTAPDLAFAYWTGMIGSAPSAQARAERLHRLRADNAAMFVRLVLASDPALEWDDADLVSLARRELHPVALLDRSEQWPELADPARFATLARWILERADRLFDASQRGDVVRLWDARALPKPLWPPLARAAAALDPTRRLQILDDALREVADQQGALLADLVTYGGDDQAAVIERWFLRTDLADLDAVRLAVIGALHGPSHARLLKRLVLDPRFRTDNPHVIEALIEAVEAIAGNVEFPHRTAMFLADGKGAQPSAAQRSKAARARQDSLSRVKTWLRDSA